MHPPDGPLQRLHDAYDPERFRTDGHRIVDLLADHLAAAASRANRQVIPWHPPAESVELWQGPRHADSLTDIVEDVIRRSINLHHPRCVGHQIMPPLPAAALAGLVADVLNNGMSVYEMGMASTAMEAEVIRVLTSSLGMGSEAGGFLTSGGTLGNLTAILTARSVKAHACHERPDGARRFAILVSDQAHYCIERAAHVAGWGAEGVIRVPSDDEYRMRVDRLEPLLQQAQSGGIEVIAAVGSACSTSTGAYDDLQAIGQFCRDHGLWFHVDGAHGAAVTFSDKYRHLIQGIEHADSVVLDFHKMLMTPVLATAVVYRRGLDGFRTFCHQAEYLWTSQEDADWFNLSKRTFECTKTMMAMKVYCLLALGGVELFDTNVTRLCDLARRFAQLVAKRPELELAVPPQANIVCFRFVAGLSGAEETSRINGEIRRRIIESGEYYIVQTRLHDELWLRTTFSNPLTTDEDLEGLLETVERLGKEASPHAVR